MIWNETKECMSRDQMTVLQSARLVKLVDYVYHNVEFYRKKMQAIGMMPGDVQSIEDITKLPFTTKDDLRDNYPFGLFAVPNSEIVRIHASSGTTGKATVVGYTRRDLEIWSECVARCLTMANVGKDDIIQVAYGYGLFTGGLGAHGGAEKIGATVVPMSTGNTKKLTTMMVDFGATAIACTPSYLLHISEALENEGLLDRIKLRSAVCGAEPWTEKMRNEIESKLGIKAYDIYGLTEIMGPGVAFECEAQTGMHVNEDHFIIEILNPATGEPVKDGEKGEIVFSCITKEAFPLLRFRTKDIGTITHEKCSCGRTFVRMSKPMGRTDDMLIIRGVNVFPSQIETVLLQMDQSPNYRILVDRKGALDTLEVQVELSEEKFSDTVSEITKVEKDISEKLKSLLGIAAKVTLVAPGTIERSEGKAKRVVDRRTLVD